MSDTNTRRKRKFVRTNGAETKTTVARTSVKDLVDVGGAMQKRSLRTFQSTSSVAREVISALGPTAPTSSIPPMPTRVVSTQKAAVQIPLNLYRIDIDDTKIMLTRVQKSVLRNDHTRVGLLARTSMITGTKRQPGTIETKLLAQVATLSMFFGCAELIGVPLWLGLESVSAAEHRPEQRRLLQQIYTQKIDAVVMCDISRIIRMAIDVNSGFFRRLLSSTRLYTFHHSNANANIDLQVTRHPVFATSFGHSLYSSVYHTQRRLLVAMASSDDSAGQVARDVVDAFTNILRRAPTVLARTSPTKHKLPTKALFVQGAFAASLSDSPKIKLYHGSGGISCTLGQDRPAIFSLIDDGQKFFVVTCLDRLCRSTSDCDDLLTLIDQKDVIVIVLFMARSTLDVARARGMTLDASILLSSLPLAAVPAKWASDIRVLTAFYANHVVAKPLVALPYQLTRASMPFVKPELIMHERFSQTFTSYSHVSVRHLCVDAQVSVDGYSSGISTMQSKRLLMYFLKNRQAHYIAVAQPGVSSDGVQTRLFAAGRVDLLSASTAPQQWRCVCVDDIDHSLCRCLCISCARLRSRKCIHKIADVRSSSFGKCDTLCVCGCATCRQKESPLEQAQRVLTTVNSPDELLFKSSQQAPQALLKKLPTRMLRCELCDSQVRHYYLCRKPFYISATGQRDGRVHLVFGACAGKS